MNKEEMIKQIRVMESNLYSLTEEIKELGMILSKMDENGEAEVVKVPRTGEEFYYIDKKGDVFWESAYSFEWRDVFESGNGFLEEEEAYTELYRREAEITLLRNGGIRNNPKLQDVTKCFFITTHKGTDALTVKSCEDCNDLPIGSIIFEDRMVAYKALNSLNNREIAGLFGKEVEFYYEEEEDDEDYYDDF